MKSPNVLPLGKLILTELGLYDVSAVGEFSRGFAEL